MNFNVMNFMQLKGMLGIYKNVVIYIVKNDLSESIFKTKSSVTTLSGFEEYVSLIFVTN